MSDAIARLDELARRINEAEAEFQTNVRKYVAENVRYDGSECRECGTRERTSRGWCAPCYVDNKC